MNTPEEAIMKHHGRQTCFPTFRTRSFWLHGDPRGSRDRYRNVPICRQGRYEAVCRYVRDETGPDRLSLAEFESKYGE
jgi:hypothetical protein